MHTSINMQAYIFMYVCTCIGDAVSFGVPTTCLVLDTLLEAMARARINAPYTTCQRLSIARLNTPLFTSPRINYHSLSIFIPFVIFSNDLNPFASQYRKLCTDEEIVFGLSEKSWEIYFPRDHFLLLIKIQSTLTLQFIIICKAANIYRVDKIIFFFS